jgi:hypothetical protein
MLLMWLLNERRSRMLRPSGSREGENRSKCLLPLDDADDLFKKKNEMILRPSGSESS